MRARPLSLAIALISLLLAPGSNAGQRRVNVGVSGTQFGPANQTLNLGDQVTWVWVGSGHSVENGCGPPCTDPLLDPNAGTIFDSTTLGVGNSAFTWKADRTGTIPYFCLPHFGFGMRGTLDIRTPANPVNVSSFRISEVQYNEATGKDRIEITNLGGDFGDFGRYRVSINGTTSQVVPLTSVGLTVGSPPGRVVIHTNEGTSGSTLTDLFMLIGDLPATGSIALYAPNTAPGTSLADETQMVDFVQWGAGNQAMAATAVAAGLWPSTTEFVDAVPPVGDYDLVFCGTNSDPRGNAKWDVAHPNFRAQLPCATPAQATTWGRIKLLYR